MGYVSEQPLTSKSAQKKPKDKSANNKLENERPHQKGTTSVHNGSRNVTHQHQQVRWTQQQRIPSTNRSLQKRFHLSHPIYDNDFYGYCFKCNQYGHKAAKCKESIMYDDLARQKSFKSMLDENIQCFRCHRYGHRIISCRENIKSNTHVSRATYASQPEYNVQCFKCHNHGHEASFCRMPFASNRWLENKFYQSQIRQQRQVRSQSEHQRMKNDQFLRMQNRQSPWINDQHGNSKIFNDIFIPRYKKVWKKKVIVETCSISHMSKTGQELEVVSLPHH